MIIMIFVLTCVFYVLLFLAIVYTVYLFIDLLKVGDFWSCNICFTMYQL